MLAAGVPDQLTQQDTAQLQEQLQELRDIHLPEAPGLALYTPGWWLVALIILTVAVTVLRWRHKKRIAPVTQALAELEQMYDELIAEPYPAQELQFAESCKALLKRLAHNKYPEQNPETMNGRIWRSFLLKTSRSAAPPEALVSALYSPNPKIMPEQLKHWTEDWIRQQK